MTQKQVDLHKFMNEVYSTPYEEDYKLQIINLRKQLQENNVTKMIQEANQITHNNNKIRLILNTLNQLNIKQNSNIVKRRLLIAQCRRYLTLNIQINNTIYSRLENKPK